MTGRAVGTSGPIDAVVRPPGSKSITNRALIAAGLAAGRSLLRGPLVSDDTDAMRAALIQLGVSVEVGDGVWEIEGGGGRLGHSASTIDARASGTTARFVTAALALAEGRHTIDGVARMRERPIGDLAEALEQMGVEVQTTDGYPPVTVVGGGLRGGTVVIDATRSSQFVSAVMLVAPYADSDVTLRFRGGVVVSRPYLATTAEVMGSFGAEVVVADEEVRVGGARYAGTDFAVEVDASAAAYPLVAAAITGGKVVIDGLDGRSSQADMGILDALAAMGCTVDRQGGAVSLTGPDGGRLEGIRIDMNAMPDAVLALAVAAVFAVGPTLIENVASLRLKETDRLAALETELRKLGVVAKAGADSLLITPTASLRGASIATYDDHRMAMAFALAGFRIAGIEIQDPGCVAKTWPGFFSELDAMRESSR